MCGIAGAVAFRDGAHPDRERLCAMAGLMAHRGPDGEGFWADPGGRAALAHRRLAIIDIAGGRQPMCSDDGQIALVFNGEIYNYRELRRSLSDQGVRFHTVSDTEVLRDSFGIAAFIEGGLRETDRERQGLPLTVASGDGRHQARIDAAAQERPEGHVTA